MISIRKYMEAPQSEDAPEQKPEPKLQPSRRAPSDPYSLFSLSVGAYRAALADMGRASIEAYPATGPALESNLMHTSDTLGAGASADKLAAITPLVRTHLQEWGRSTARHLQQKAGEVKGILLAMAHTAESVGQRDQRCAEQMNAVTAQLQRIANLDDITEMRSSIEKSAAELKGSVERMMTDGRAVLDELRRRAATFQARLEEAEKIAACDALTRLRSRLCVDAHLEERIAARARFCVALLDIDGFKLVNDTHGHVVGDELLRQFARELRSACRSSDVVGRWGGDEFVVLLDCGIDQARAQMERVRKWACGNYDVQGANGPLKLSIAVSVGLAEYVAPETLKQFLDRADAEMYRHKAQSRTALRG